MVQVKGAISFLTLISVSFWINEATASWAKTDKKAKTIARMEDQLHRQWRRADLRFQDDVVLSRDEKKEAALEAENRLVDAYMDLLYMAYVSPNRQRYLQRLARHLPAEKVTAIDHFLSELPTLKKDKEPLPWVIDSICQQAELMAKKQITLALNDYRAPVKYAGLR